MLKMCQILHPLDAPVPWAPLHDLATLTTGLTNAIYAYSIDC